MAGPRGPLPDPNARRRNAPTIPTTRLPVSGRQEPAPEVPSWYKLGSKGEAWWDLAWSTPQACAWSIGDRPLIARRAWLEDQISEYTEIKDMTPILREMRELDDRLGLSPAGLARLRWEIVADAPVEPEKASVPTQDDQWERLLGDDAS